MNFTSQAKPLLLVTLLFTQSNIGNRRGHEHYFENGAEKRDGHCAKKESQQLSHNLQIPIRCLVALFRSLRNIYKISESGDFFQIGDGHHFL